MHWNLLHIPFHPEKHNSLQQWLAGTPDTVYLLEGNVILLGDGSHFAPNQLQYIVVQVQGTLTKLFFAQFSPMQKMHLQWIFFTEGVWVGFLIPLKCCEKVEILLLNLRLEKTRVQKMSLFIDRYIYITELSCGTFLFGQLQYTAMPYSIYPRVYKYISLYIPVYIFQTRRPDTSAAWYIRAAKDQQKPHLNNPNMPCLASSNVIPNSLMI